MTLPTLALTPLLLLGGWPDLFFDLTLSASASDPFVNSGPVSGMTLDIYFWVVCEESNVHGVSIITCALAPPPGVINLGYDPITGLNAGDDTDILQAISGCPRGPFVAGVWHVTNTAAGSYCLAPHPTEGLFVWDFCRSHLGDLGSVRQIGYAAGGGTAACIQTEGFACGPTSVEPTSWGRVRALFR